MGSLKLSTFNCNGLGNEKKRREVFSWLKTCNKASIILLQETHSTKDSEAMWCNEWGHRQLYFSHGTSQSKGVCIIVQNNFPFQLHQTISDTEGRYLLLDVTVYDTRLTIANIYGPNEENEEFYEEVVTKIESIPNDHRICAGDFNFVFDVNLDKIGKPETNAKNRDIVRTWMEETDVIDVWRFQHPEERKFTWHGKRG